MSTTTPPIRSLKQLGMPKKLPTGGSIHKLDLKPSIFDTYNLEDLRLFVSLEWQGTAGNPSYLYYKDSGRDKGWYLYSTNEIYQQLMNIIAVPGEMTEEEYYSTAIFTHVATPHNTLVPECDTQTSAENTYVTYIDDARINGRPDLQLIVSKVLTERAHTDPQSVLYYTAWYDPDSRYSASDRHNSLPIGRWAIAYPSFQAIPEGTRFNVMAMGGAYEEHHHEGEGHDYLKRAFAFEHDVKNGRVLSTNHNTTVLDINQSEKLLEELTAYKKRHPERKLPENPLSTQLIVVSTERWLGPVYTEEIIERTYPESEWAVKKSTWVGSLRQSAGINNAPISVWYIPKGFKWGDTPVKLEEEGRWAIFTVSNEPIDLIKINVCTRLPCPSYCDP
jgi:hypothetical protein